MYFSISFIIYLGFLAIVATNSSHLQKYTIYAPGINATFIPYGARLTSLFVYDKNGTPQDVVLGYDNAKDYLNDTQTVHTYYGAIVGRYANRIKNGTFNVQDVTSHVSKNENKATILCMEDILDMIKETGPLCLSIQQP